MIAKKPDAAVRYARYRPGRWDEVDAFTIVEAPLTLSINGEAWLTFLCTPTDLDALAVGFLFNEGVIQTIAEVVSIDVCASGDQVDVWLTHTAEKPPSWRRTSGCSGGVTAASLPAASKEARPGENGGNGHPANLSEAVEPISPEQILRLMALFLESQQLYRKTRGVHSSALSDGERILVSADDIGRHNTLDKIAGRCLLEGLSTNGKILLTTGRVSSEMLQKAHRLGAGVLVSRTAPNSLSIQLAQETGITLIGYARRNEFQLYTHPERIAAAPIPIQNHHMS